MNTTFRKVSAEDYQKIKSSEAIIKSTLKYPLNHQFIVGKPNIQEKVTSVFPKYSTVSLNNRAQCANSELRFWVSDNGSFNLVQRNVDENIFDNSPKSVYNTTLKMWAFVIGVVGWIS